MRCKHDMLEGTCAYCLAPERAKQEQVRKLERKVKSAVGTRLARTGPLNATTLELLHERANIRFQCAPRHLSWLRKLYAEVTHETLPDEAVCVYAAGDELGTSSTGHVGAKKWSWSSAVTFTATDDELAALDLGDVEVHNIGDNHVVTNNDFTIALLSCGLRPRV